MPVAFVVTYGSKILLAVCVGDALAVIVDGDRHRVAARIGAPRDDDLAVVPASCPAWMPFSTRFASTRLSSSLSARTVTGSRGGDELRACVGERRIEPELLDHLGERDRRLLDLRQLAERAERIDEPAQASISSSTISPVSSSSFA